MHLRKMAPHTIRHPKKLLKKKSCKFEKYLKTPKNFAKTPKHHTTDASPNFIDFYFLLSQEFCVNPPRFRVTFSSKKFSSSASTTRRSKSTNKTTEKCRNMAARVRTDILFLMLYGMYSSILRVAGG